MQDADLDSVNDGLSEALASIPADPAPAEPAPEAAPEGDGSQPRDERGRFKSDAEKAEEAAAESAGTTPRDDDKDGQVPSWRLRELREERDKIAAEREVERRELQQFRQHFANQQRQQREAYEAPQRPDLINDPEGFAEYIQNLIREGRQADREADRAQYRADRINDTFTSLRAALVKDNKGEEAIFDQAFAALERAPEAVKDEVVATVNPANAMMRWHKWQVAMTEVGDDLEGYRKRLRDEFKKDPEFRKEFMADLDAEASGNSGRSSTNVTSLPSLNRAPGGGNRQQLGIDLGGSDREAFEVLSVMDKQGRR